MKNIGNRLVAGMMLATIGMASSAFGGWTTGSYADDEYVEVANRVNGGTGTLLDGKVTTQADVSNYASFTFSFDDPVDLTDVRIYSRWPDTGRVKFTTSNLWVKISGSSDFIELPNTAADCRNNVPSTNRLYAALSADSGDFIATHVTALKLNFDFASGFIGVGEIEVAGTPSEAESMEANYSVTSGQLSATATSSAARYPVDAYFCSGDTNGGDSTNGWDRVVKVQTLTSEADVASWSGTVAFRYCRFVFASKKYAGEWVWSEAGDVAQSPVGSVAIGTTTHTNAQMTVTLSKTGEPTSVADIYLAYGTAENPTDYARIAKNVAVGAHAFTLNKLTEHTTYHYSVMLSNACEKTCTIAGSFMTPWSPEELERPFGTATVEDIRSARAEMKIRVDSTGTGSDTTDMWFAFVAHGGSMPALELISVGAVATSIAYKTLFGLTGSTTYDYRIVLSNALDRTREITGSFTTTQAPFDDPDTPVAREIPYRALPPAYTQVEWLQSPEKSGTWWINTGVKTKATTFMDLDFMLGSFPGDFCGQDVQDNPTDWRPYITEGRTIFDIGAYRIDRGGTFALNTRYRLRMGYNGTSLIFNVTSGVEQVYSASTALSSAGSKILDEDFYLFGCRGQRGVGSANAKIWSCILKNDGAIERDFVPAIRVSDGEPGLYDVVSGELFTDSGTGSYGKFRTGDTVLGMGVAMSAEYSFTTKEWTLTFDVTAGSGALYAVVQDAAGNRKVVLVKEDAAVGDHLVHKLEIPVGDEYQIGYKTIAGTFKDYVFVKTTHQKPVGEIVAQNVTMTNAEIVVTLTTAGELEPTSDLYFAYAKEGEEMPALAKMAIGMSDGMAYTNLLSGLDHSTAYNCLAAFSNSVYGISLPLAFSTRKPCNWHIGTFDPADFTLPEHWLSGGVIDGGYRDSKVNGSSSYWTLSATSTNVWNFAEPQDIYTIDFYFNSSADRQAGIAFGNVLVKYEGADDYVEIPNSSLDYVTGGSKATLLASLDSLTGVIATNVVSVRVPAVQVNGGNTRLYESVMTGEASHRKFVAWDIGECTTNDFVRAADAILPGNAFLKSSSGLATKESDGSLDCTGYTRGTGHTYEWQFTKPFNVRTIELYSNGGLYNGNPDMPRSYIQVASVWALFDGATEWTQLGGGSFGLYSFGGIVKRACLTSCRGDAFALRGVKGVRVVMGAPYIAHAQPYMAEVQLCGRIRTGLVIIVK